MTEIFERGGEEYHINIKICINFDFSKAIPTSDLIFDLIRFRQLKKRKKKEEKWIICIFLLKSLESYEISKFKMLMLNVFSHFTLSLSKNYCV